LSGFLKPNKETTLKIGMMTSDLSGETLDYIKAIGVNHICAVDHRHSGYDEQGYWDPEPMVEMRKHVESHGIQLDMVALPLPSSNVDRSPMPNIMLATPERDVEIERVIRCIRAAAQAGIPAVKGNLAITGVLSTEPEIGRGGALHRAFDLSKLEAPQTWKDVTAEETWERIAYFCDRVAPAAEEAQVRVAIHPHDPAVPRGIGLDHRVLGDIDGLKRFCALSPSPYHAYVGLNFCQGCMTETGVSKETLIDAIRYFGSRKRLFLVHFRNICGGANKFREAFVDEGDMDMLATMRAYQEVGYEHMIVPDHYPHIPGDSPWGHQSRAYAIGYVKALIAATGGETG
jgi:mannonate dehydratase